MKPQSSHPRSDVSAPRRASTRATATSSLSTATGSLTAATRTRTRTWRMSRLWPEQRWARPARRASAAPQSAESLRPRHKFCVAISRRKPGNRCSPLLSHRPAEISRAKSLAPSPVLARSRFAPFLSVPGTPRSPCFPRHCTLSPRTVPSRDLFPEVGGSGSLLHGRAAWKSSASFLPLELKAAEFFCLERNMGCIFSTEAVDDVGGPSSVETPVQCGEIHVFVPGFREPKQIDLTELLKGSVSAGMAARLHSLRSQIVDASGQKKPTTTKLTRRKSADGDIGGLDLEKALKDYLPVLLGLVTGGEKLSSGVEFPWTNVVDDSTETALASGYYELLSVLHLLGMLAVQEANVCLTPRQQPPMADGYSNPKANEENRRNAIEILLKAASYFECAIKAVLPNTPEVIKAKLPADVTEAMLRSLEQQALGQAVELQIGFAVGNVKASLAVKRRLACEQVEVWEEAMQKLDSVPLKEALRDIQVRFVKWKLTEAKAAAYYFHGLILDEGYEDNTHAEALSCLKASHAFLKESQKARMEFGTMEPLTKVPPLWGPMKYLAQRIPREVLSKARIFRDNYAQEKMPGTTPKLPEFPIALEADPYHLPPVDSSWKKERGYEPRPSLTPNIPSFLARGNSAQSRPVSDLRRAGALAPPLIVPDMVQAR